jgi:hypothetical protein
LHASSFFIKLYPTEKSMQCCLDIFYEFHGDLIHIKIEIVR